MRVFQDLPGFGCSLASFITYMTTFATTTDGLKVMSTGLTATVTDNGGYIGTAWATTIGDLRITDTLVLAVFSVVYEIAVVLLRFRSRLSASSPR